MYLVVVYTWQYETRTIVEDAGCIWWKFLLVQAQLLSETQIADNEKQAYVVAQATNEQLTKKLEDAEKKVDQLQDSVQRFVTSLLVEAFGVLSLSLFFFGWGGGGVGVIKHTNWVLMLQNCCTYLQFCPLLAD